MNFHPSPQASFATRFPKSGIERHSCIVMVIYQSRFLTRGEVWFDNQPTRAPVDWILYHQRSQPLAKGKWRPFYTRVIDLRQTPDELMAQMDGFTAADIRKAQKKDQTFCRRLDHRAARTLEEFANFYDRFAARKGLGPVDRHWLSRTAEARKLELWAAETPEGQPLVYATYYRDKTRVRGMHTASLQAELPDKKAQRKIGRANRLLVWENALSYQADGVELYDLGGWYNGTSDAARLGINKFKESFGGKVLCEYQGQQLLTLKAWSAIHLAKLLNNLRARKLSAQTKQLHPGSNPVESKVMRPPNEATA
jgi:hypothetical protein